MFLDFSFYVVMLCLKVVIPIFFSLRYLKSGNTEKIEAILKFWCINAIYMILEFILPLMFNSYFIYPLHIGVFVLLTMKNYQGSAQIFDKLILPHIEQHKDLMLEKKVLVENTVTKYAENVTSKITGEFVKFFPRIYSFFVKTAIETVSNQKQDDKVEPVKQE